MPGAIRSPLCSTTGTININNTVNVAYFLGQNPAAGVDKETSTYNIGSGGSLVVGGYVGVNAGNTQNWNVTGTGNISVFHLGSQHLSDQAGSSGTMTIASSATVACATLYVGKGGNTAGEAVTTGTVNQTGGSSARMPRAVSTGRIGGGNGSNDPSRLAPTICRRHL